MGVTVMVVRIGFSKHTITPSYFGLHQGTAWFEWICEMTTLGLALTSQHFCGLLQKPLHEMTWKTRKGLNCHEQQQNHQLCSIFFGVMLCCSMFSEVARVLHDRFFGAALRKYTSTMEHIVSSEFNNCMSSYIYTQLYTHNYICMMYVYNLQIYNYVYILYIYNIYVYIYYILYISKHIPVQVPELSFTKPRS